MYCAVQYVLPTGRLKQCGVQYHLLRSTVERDRADTSEFSKNRTTNRKASL
jgi:hypothetical protein